MFSSVRFFSYGAQDGAVYTMPNGKMVQDYTDVHWHPQGLGFMTCHIPLANWQALLEH